LTLAAAALSLIPAAKAQDTATGPVVVELFTSQSCSSCPPADKVLSEIAAENPNVIALSCNVTYWNHLHWTDTLSHEFCTDRQRDYAYDLKSRGPYTPQAVINGQFETVGSQGGQVRRFIDKAEALPEIKIAAQTESLSIALPDIEKEGYRLTLFTYDDGHTQKIASGENSGLTVHYTNPVKAMHVLENWDGGARSIEFSLKSLAVSDGFVVIAQDRNGRIRAAGRLKS
jgi:hypothetical protein